MKKIIAYIAGIIIVVSLLVFAGCKTSEETSGDCLLTVNMGSGVTGYPGSGTSYYNLGDVVDYNYELLDGYLDLEVLLDGVAIDPSGTFTVTGDHYLDAYSTAIDDYRLTVYTSSGVLGTPETGTYEYEQGDRVDYSYTLEAGYTNLNVWLDGVEVDTTGTIVISGSHDLDVYASKEYYIQGAWTLEESYADDSAFAVDVTFTGDVEAGTVVDSDGGVGEYTVDINDIAFTLVFPDVTYEYTGNFTGDDSMGGEARRYTGPDTYSLGEWTATRTTAETRSTAIKVHKGMKKNRRRR